LLLLLLLLLLQLLLLLLLLQLALVFRICSKITKNCVMFCPSAAVFGTLTLGGWPRHVLVAEGGRGGGDVSGLHLQLGVVEFLFVVTAAAVVVVTNRSRTK